MEPKDAKLDKIPLEGYRIIEDEPGIVADYLLAAYSLAMEYVSIRAGLQDMWRQVAFYNLHTVVGATLSSIGLGIVIKLQSEISADFPGHESFETKISAITRGDLDQSEATLHLWNDHVPNGPARAQGEVIIDVKETFLMHTYRALLDFLTDFQKTRSGQPTKPMLKTIRNWDPNFDIQHASKEARLEGRRSYIISWLYDLANLFSFPILLSNAERGGKNTPLEAIDWSIHGNDQGSQRVLVLNDFASEITTLAMQKPGSNIRPKTLPHVVFRLQCLVDSFTISRVWFPNGLPEEEKITAPAENFC